MRKKELEVAYDPIGKDCQILYIRKIVSEHTDTDVVGVRFRVDRQLCNILDKHIRVEMCVLFYRQKDLR